MSTEAPLAVFFKLLGYINEHLEAPHDNILDATHVKPLPLDFWNKPSIRYAVPPNERKPIFEVMKGNAAYSFIDMDIHPYEVEHLGKHYGCRVAYGRKFEPDARIYVFMYAIREYCEL